MNFSRTLILLFWLYINCCLNTDASGEVTRTETPSWVKAPSWDKTVDDLERKSEDRDIHYHLFNRQLNTTLSEEAAYWHMAYRFLTGNGVQTESQLEISFDPEYETIKLHSLRIHRDGEIIDRLATQNIEIIQREEDINRHLFDGRLSAVLLLEDVRVGDVLEYSYTREGSNPVFEGYYGRSFSTEWGVMIDSASCRLLWDNSIPLRIKAHGREIPPSISKGDRITEYNWELSGKEPVVSDGDLPSWFDARAWVQLSSFKSWEEVTRWALGIYELESEIPRDLLPIVDRIRQLESSEEQALAAIRYVQDEIRYFGVESGVNSHKPHSLESIATRRFGDCKDKSILLVAMLRNLGFEAYPALVNTTEERTIEGWLPAISAFNHVTVQLVHDGQIIWIDPTIQLQGGSLENLHYPDYGKALVVSPYSKELTTIENVGGSISSLKTIESFDFQDFGGQAILRIESEYAGREADKIRRTLSRSSLNELGKNYLNFYSEIYKEVTPIDSPQFYDNREKNIVISFESYQISDFWKPEEPGDDDDFERLAAIFKAWNFTGYLTTPDTRKRTMPFSLGDPLILSHEIKADFPWPLNFETDSLEFDLESCKGRFERSSQNGSLRLRYDYDSKKNFVSAENSGEYIKSIEALENKGFYSFTIPRFWAEPDSVIPEQDDSTGRESEAASGKATEEKLPIVLTQSNKALMIGLITLSLVLILLLAFIMFLIRKMKQQNHRSHKATPPPLPSQRNRKS